MTLRDYTANVISASKVVPDGNFKTSKASGVWDINEALDLIKGGNWPNAANIDPASFVDALFSTDVWDGSGSARSITTDIDLSTKEGLVWIKKRSGSANHTLQDTVRGATKHLRSSGDSSESTEAQTITAFNSNGFSLGTDDLANASSSEYVGWTFRSQPKFFDVVTYTGNATARTIAHNLGSTPGMIIVKKTSGSGAWYVFHRSSTDADGKIGLTLNSTDAQGDFGNVHWDVSEMSSTHFGLGNMGNLNGNGSTYVAYLFAHNNDDGGFGEPGDQDIIKCGSYTNSGSGVEVNLGFEPQFMMFKRTDATSNWGVVDTMRGIPTPVTSAGDNSTQLRWNLANAENAEYHPFPTPTGFKVVGSAGGGGGGSGTFIYMAIRRGGMQTPTTASDVFAVDTSTSDSSGDVLASTFPVDMYLNARRDGGSHGIMARLTRTRLFTDTDSAEGSLGSYVDFDRQTGIKRNALLGNASTVDYMWKRARGYFDVVTYTGNNTLRTINHNLGVVPEMMWFKRRDSADIWTVYHSALGEGKRLKLHQNTAAEDDVTSFNNTAPTSTVFTINQNVNQLNANNSTYIAYLFATAAGVSKIGSYTGNGNATGPTVDCGFTNGTKFVLFKRTSGLQNWYFYDTTRGLTSGDDKTLELNSTATETTGQVLNSTTSGFQLATADSFANENGSTFIFYAIANDPS